MNLALICFNPVLRDSLQKVLVQIPGFIMKFEDSQVVSFLSNGVRCEIDVLIIDDYTAQQNIDLMQTLVRQVQSGILILTDPDDPEIWNSILDDSRFRVLQRNSKKKEFEIMINKISENHSIIHL